jgi:uncharacterized protein YlxP (DUF503 family)
MNVGAGRIVLDFYNNDDAALKRRKLAELCDDLRKRFNVSALEVADFDDPERCVIGFAAVIPEHWKAANAEDFVERICRSIDETSFARVMVEEREMFYLGGD